MMLTLKVSLFSVYYTSNQHLNVIDSKTDTGCFLLEQKNKNQKHSPPQNIQYRHFFTIVIHVVFNLKGSSSNQIY